MGRFIEPTINCTCGKTFDNPLYSDKITDEQRTQYINNDIIIQKIMPDVDLTTRECLISGTCPECQKELYGE